MRAWILLGLSTLLSGVFLALLMVPGLGSFAILVISDGGQLVAAAAAAVGCAYAARRSRPAHRAGWWLIAVGTGGWATGQLVWSYYEVVLDEEVPFPSLADAGYLLFPLAAGAGLVLWLHRRGDRLARARDVLDGAIIAGSMLTLSWVTVLGSVMAQGGETWLAEVLSVGYPLGDVVLGTLVLLALSRGTGPDKATLLLLAAGLGGVAVSDSAYVYLVSVDGYTSANLLSAGWVAGFLFVAAAALDNASRDPLAVAGNHPGRASQSPTIAWRRAWLPYLPLVAAGLVIWRSLLRAPTTPVANLYLGIALVMLVLVRQFVAMSDNHRLLVELHAARDELQHRALHDPLTGLANRALFADRLEHAVVQRTADVTVLFCDLDDFKNVNDGLGHDAGDALLCLVAQRLLACVRPADTVARLGGDEFAVLLDGAIDPHEVADRIVVSIQRPYEICDTEVHTSISIGVSHYAADEELSRSRHVLRAVGEAGPGRRADCVPGATWSSQVAEQLLRDADIAMYGAKATGKGRAVHAQTKADDGTSESRVSISRQP